MFASHREPKTRANRSKATTKKPANAIKQPTRLGSLDIFRSWRSCYHILLHWWHGPWLSNWISPAIFPSHWLSYYCSLYHCTLHHHHPIQRCKKYCTLITLHLLPLPTAWSQMPKDVNVAKCTDNYRHPSCRSEHSTVCYESIGKQGILLKSWILDQSLEHFQSSSRIRKLSPFIHFIQPPLVSWQAAQSHWDSVKNCFWEPLSLRVGATLQN